MEGKEDDRKLKDPKSVSSQVLEYYQRFSQTSELPKYFCGSSESFKKNVKISPRSKGDDSCFEESVVEVVCPVSPASSVTSNRKLEWDNGADIGYNNASTNLLLQKSISLPVLNTIEYEKLQKTLLRLSPEGNDNETLQVPPQQPSLTTSESVTPKHESVPSTSSSSGQRAPPPAPSTSSSASTSKSFVLKDFMKKIGLPMAESTPYSNLETISCLETPRLTSKPTRNPRTIINSPSKSSSCDNLSLPKNDNLKVTKPVVIDCSVKTRENKLIQTSLPKNSSIALQTEPLPNSNYEAVYIQRSSDESSDVESKCTSFEYHSGTEYVEEVPEPEKVENKPNSSKSSESSTEIPLAELLAINRSEHDVINLQKNLELMQKLIKSKKYSDVTKKHYLKKIAKKMIDNSGTWMKSETKIEQEDKRRLSSEKEEEIKDGRECGHCLQPRYQSVPNLKDKTESSLENVSKESEIECAHSLKILPSKTNLPAAATKSSANFKTETFSNEILPQSNAKTEGSRLRRNPLFTLAKPEDTELENDILKGARGDTKTSVESSQSVTLSSSSSDTRTKNWREDTTRSEQLREQKLTPSGEHLLDYASKEREHQLGWIRNEISHLSKLKKLLEAKDAKKKHARHTALQKVLQKPIVEDMKGIKKATTVYVLTTEKNGNSSYPCECRRVTGVSTNQIGNVPNLETNQCICGERRDASPTARSPSLVGHNVNVNSNLGDLQNLRMVSNECFTTQKNSNNGRTTVRRYTFELPMESSTSKSTIPDSLDSKSGKSSKYSKPSSKETNEEPSTSTGSDPVQSCREKSPCRKCCIPKAPKLGCQLVISDEVCVRPESRSPTNTTTKKCVCCTNKKRRLSQELVSANEIVPESAPRDLNQICTCCRCNPPQPRNGRLSKQSFPNEQIVIRHRSRSPPQKCACCQCGRARRDLAAELVSSEEYVVEARTGYSQDNKENQTCMCCVCKHSKFNKARRFSSELVSSEDFLGQPINSGNKNKICMCTPAQGDDKEIQICVCCSCQTSQTDKKPELRGELVSSEEIVESSNRLMASKIDRPSQTSEGPNKFKSLSGELVLSEEIVNQNRPISPSRNKVCSCQFIGEDKENQTCTCCECFLVSGETQTLQKVVGEEAIQTQDGRRGSRSQETQTLEQQRALEKLLEEEEMRKKRESQIEEEMRKKRESQIEEEMRKKRESQIEEEMRKKRESQIEEEEMIKKRESQIQEELRRKRDSQIEEEEMSRKSLKSKMEEEEMSRKSLESKIEEEEMRRHLLESKLKEEDADKLSKTEETQTAKLAESDSLNSTTSRTSSSTTTTTQSMLCACCKQSNGRPPPMIINKEKIYLCRPCSSQTRGFDYCNPKPTFLYPGHVCQCSAQNDNVRKIRETIRELETLELEEEYCKCMLNRSSRSKSDYCARCKCKIKSKYNAKKGGLAYLLTLESDDKLHIDENGEEVRELKEIKIKIPSRRHRKSRGHDREKGPRDESPEGGRKEKRSSASKNHEKTRRHSKKDSRNPSLQEYLCTNKPEFVYSAEERRKCMLELAYMREERCQKYKQLLALSDGIPPEGSGYQRPSLFSHGEMIRTTSKKYNKLPEVQKKVADAKEQQVKKANKLLADIFNQKLRQKVLRGVHTLPTSASVIKF